MAGSRLHGGRSSESVCEGCGNPLRRGALGDLGDAQLLERFLEHDRDGQAAEMAFAALVERHAPMVLRVCAGVLGDVHDAQDVSQATFLVLAQRAGSVRRRGSVGELAPWGGARGSRPRSSGARRVGGPTSGEAVR